MISLSHNKQSPLFKMLSVFVIFTFVGTLIAPSASFAQAVPVSVMNLPAPGAMVGLTPGYTPSLIRGIKLFPENPFQFDFIIDSGDSKIEGEALKIEANRLVKYFLATLTVPGDELWVNLSPYEKDRLISKKFGETDMGRDLLAQDYILKQLTASLTYPEKEIGKSFWSRVYKRAQEEFGTTDIPMNTFNKIWVVPAEALVYEYDQGAIVANSRLKVMLEEDYLALDNYKSSAVAGLEKVDAVSGIQSAIVKEILIPEIEKEVNEGESFASLRQIYNSVLLATWYKENLKNTLLGQVYVNQNKTAGIDIADKDSSQKIYKQYVKAFEEGVYDYIKEDFDATTDKIIPRKYFSGGSHMGQVEFGSSPTSAFRVEPYPSSAASSPDFSSLTSVLVVVSSWDDLSEEQQNTLRTSTKYAQVIPAELDVENEGEEGSGSNKGTKGASSSGVGVLDLVKVKTASLNPTVEKTIATEIDDKSKDVGAFVRQAAEIYNPGALEVITENDLDRLVAEELGQNVMQDFGQSKEFGTNTYLAKTHPEDVVRVIHRTFMSSEDSNDAGFYNNWKPKSELAQPVMNYFENALGGQKKLYVLPYTMEPNGADFGKANIQLTDSRSVAIQMLMMTRVGKEAWDKIKRNNGEFNRGIHLTGDLDNIKRSNNPNDEDDRYFIQFADEGLTVSHGSEYGGNVIFGKKFISLRQAQYESLKEYEKSGRLVMAEHMALLKLTDKVTGKVKYFAYAAPSNSGKTNFAMIGVPEIFKDKYQIEMISDDIIHVEVREEFDAEKGRFVRKMYAFNPEGGVFGVVTGTDPNTNPNFWNAIHNSEENVVFTNMAYNPVTQEIWWSGKGEPFPEDITNWHDWKGNLISDRVVTDDILSKLSGDNAKAVTEYIKEAQIEGLPVAQFTVKQINEVRKRMATWEHPNGRATVMAKAAPNLAPEYNNAEGVPLDGIFFGGRVEEEGVVPKIVNISDTDQAIFQLMTMSVRTTAAEAGAVGKAVYDMAAMKPFMGSAEAPYIQHWFRVFDYLNETNDAPAMFNVNWFAKDPKTGQILVPWFDNNVRVLDWASRLIDGEASFIETPLGRVPATDADGIVLKELPEDHIENFSRVQMPNPEKGLVAVVDSLRFLNEELAPANKLPLPDRLISAGERLQDKLKMASSAASSSASDTPQSFPTLSGKANMQGNLFVYETPETLPTAISDLLSKDLDGGRVVLIANADFEKSTQVTSAFLGLEGRNRLALKGLNGVLNEFLARGGKAIGVQRHVLRAHDIIVPENGILDPQKNDSELEGKIKDLVASENGFPRLWNIYMTRLKPAISAVKDKMVEIGRKVFGQDNAYINFHVLDLEVLDANGKLQTITTYNNTPVTTDETQVVNVGDETRAVWRDIVEQAEAVVLLGDTHGLEGILDPVEGQSRVLISANDAELLASEIQKIAATETAASSAVGGIDLNPELIKMDIKRDGKGMPLPAQQQPVFNMNIDGLLPVIINVTPIPSLPLYLGLADTTDGDVADDFDRDMPADRKARFELDKAVEQLSYLN